ncbi:zinc ribbon domain-containing protein [Virgibacillus sp. MSP4-1]|uniref:FxLYD domain-containing protein n=1 Tax=Virgibacillus sp. MSP4-1 TaxID=2700081 RepID=UPI00039E3F09|nr:FxLYD domain-containing protein [Virgibacillus sp. MSP4-1]QHS22073.1 zinc ribbon domain-containing protein [Virgibacillus sp. MSP4-1]
MAHCPFCGTEVKQGEEYCINCGKEMPTDLAERIPKNQGFNKWWFLPIGALFLAILVFIGYYFFLSSQENQALETYKKADKVAVDGNFQQAKKLYKEAQQYKSEFPAAVQNAQFMDIAMSIQQQLNSAKNLQEENAFQQAIKITKQAEEDLQNYNGEVVDKLLDQLVKTRNEIKTAEVKERLSQEPSVEELKLLLWEAEGIQTDKARNITKKIRTRLVNYTYTKANESLKSNHFTDAMAIIEDGLRYAPESEKLQSLKTTIEKEKVAFETEQQKRIEQAINAAEQEYKLNKNDAIEMVSIEAKKDDFGDLIVSGTLKSVATVPIYSVSVSYNLLDKNGEIVETNEVYIYPDTLYPEEEGNFEFTHYEMDKELKAEVDQVKWFLDSP